MKSKKILLYLMVVLSLVTGYLQLRYTMALNYTDQVRYAEDCRVAGDLIERIAKLEDESNSYPVVVFGAYHSKLNNACIRGDVIGASFFEWDVDVEPYGVYNTRRVLGFFHTLGANYVQADVDTTAKALEASADMTCYPTADSVQLVDGVIIVKLSER